MSRDLLLHTPWMRLLILAPGLHLLADIILSKKAVFENFNIFSQNLFTDSNIKIYNGKSMQVKIAGDA